MSSVENIRADHRLWLGKHGLLDRPWFVLGSAPDPTIPPGIASHAALICINNAGATAARLGLPPASLTIRNRNKEWASVAGQAMPLVLWMTDKNALSLWWTLLLRSKARVGEVRVMGTGDRQRMLSDVLGVDLSEVGTVHKPSTGVFAVLYGLSVGVPEIVVGGMSVDKKGYSYEAPPARMLHAEEDRFVLQKIAESYSSVRTTEPIIADQTGIPLIRSADAAAGEPPASGG